MEGCLAPSALAENTDTRLVGISAAAVNQGYDLEGEDALSAGSLPDSVLLLPHLQDVELYQVNNGQNCVGLIVDPTKHDLGFSFSVEIFEPGTVTEMTTNPGYELFYVLSGSGTAFCADLTGGGGASGGVKVPVSKLVEFDVGDSLLFPPQTVHGLRCSKVEKVVVLGLMLHAPGAGQQAEEFVSWATKGKEAGSLSAEVLSVTFRNFAQGSNTPGPARTVRRARAFNGKQLFENAGQAGKDPANIWPAHRPIDSLHAKHLQNAEGIATKSKPTNRLLLVFDSRTLPFNFALEMFDQSHTTPRHSHPAGHELFYILQGEGMAYCDGYCWPVKAGDTCVFPTGSVHAIDNTGPGKMMTLELMVPSNPEDLINESEVAWDTTCLMDGTTGKVNCSELSFAAAILDGTAAEDLSDEDMCGFAPRKCT